MLGEEPKLETIVPGPDADEFQRQLTGLGVPIDGAETAAPRASGEYDHVEAVLVEARSAGYSIDQRRGAKVR